MFNTSSLTILLLITHFLADYQFQSEGLVERKHKSLGPNATHIAIHALTLLPIFILSIVLQEAGQFLLMALVLLVNHFIVDIMKILATRNWPKQARGLYLFDQLAHIVIVIAVSEFAFVEMADVFRASSLQDYQVILKFILLLVLVTKPANVTFRTLFTKYQDEATQGDDTVPGAGAIIGNMERIISAVFLATNNIASIALIYTAKSIARFKQMEDKQFAEYYLIGTLYSILFVVGVYLLIFEVM